MIDEKVVELINAGTPETERHPMCMYDKDRHCDKSCASWRDTIAVTTQPMYSEKLLQMMPVALMRVLMCQRSGAFIKRLDVVWTLSWDEVKESIVNWKV